ncbi:type IV secretory system conjugative DNA transfer family protein [Nakamurella endophytica]|uniref:type IV secretory system conjugative DNA transfer family protein n=1 Tax=Nakamurella endophytica TaxID=1748367 RepID=UPI001664BDE6|nr:TraM recognition domain-containing protein [Nakamurella endophytica]
MTAGASSGTWLLLAGGAVLAAAMLAAPLLAGHLAYLVTGRGWPDAGSPAAAAVGMLAHPGDPTRGWPEPAGRPGPVLVWALTAVLLTGLVAVAATAVLLVRRVHRPATAGVATRAQETRSMTADSLRARAGSLRPQLAATTTPRELRPEQLGARLGRSVASGRDVWRAIETSSIVTGLSESGKTTSVVIPAVLDWEGRQVVSTTKTDILRCTWAAAADRGGLRVFDPLRLSGGVFPELSWTPIQGCADPNIAEARTKVLTERAAGPDPHADFAADGRRVVRALLHAAGLADATVTELLGWVYNPLDQRPEQIIRGSSRGYQLYAEELASVRKTPDRQREGSYLSVRSAFDGMSTPQVLAVIDHRPSRAFNATRWLAEGTDSLYLLTHNTMLAGATKIVSLIVADILDAARHLAAASTGARLDPPLPIIADESVNTCRLPDWETVLSDSRGWGISAHMVVQTRSLLRGAYGRDQGEAIWSAAGMRMMVGGGEGGADSKEVAEAFGDVEVATYSRDTAGTVHSLSSRRQATRTVADVRNTPPGRAIVLASQMPPVEIELTPWWRRPDAAHVHRAAEDYDDARAHHLPLARRRP